MQAMCARTRSTYHVGRPVDSYIDADVCGLATPLAESIWGSVTALKLFILIRVVAVPLSFITPLANVITYIAERIARLYHIGIFLWCPDVQWPMLSFPSLI